MNSEDFVRFGPVEQFGGGGNAGGQKKFVNSWARVLTFALRHAIFIALRPEKKTSGGESYPRLIELCCVFIVGGCP